MKRDPPVAQELPEKRGGLGDQHVVHEEVLAL